jgi:hypothetical protein
VSACSLLTAFVLAFFFIKSEHLLPFYILQYITRVYPVGFDCALIALLLLTQRPAVEKPKKYFGSG